VPTPTTDELKALLRKVIDKQKPLAIKARGLDAGRLVEAEDLSETTLPTLTNEVG